MTVVGLDPAQVMTRLQNIERDLEERQNEWEEAAEEQARLKRDYEKRYASALVAAPKSLTVDERKAQALLAVAADPEDVYMRLKDAEGKVQAASAAYRVLETRATIGQSILRAMARHAA